MKTAIRTDRLRRLTDHLINGKLIHEKFDFTVLNDGKLNQKGCGTMGCAIGECPAVFKQWTFITYSLEGYANPRLIKLSTGYSILDAGIFFNLYRNQASALFYPNSQSDFPLIKLKKLGNNATKEQVANNIIKFCNWADKQK